MTSAGDNGAGQRRREGARRGRGGKNIPSNGFYPVVVKYTVRVLSRCAQRLGPRKKVVNSRENLTAVVKRTSGFESREESINGTKKKTKTHYGFFDTSRSAGGPFRGLQRSNDEDVNSSGPP